MTAVIITRPTRPGITCRITCVTFGPAELPTNLKRGIDAGSQALSRWSQSRRCKPYRFQLLTGLELLTPLESARCVAARNCSRDRERGSTRRCLRFRAIAVVSAQQVHRIRCRRCKRVATNQKGLRGVLLPESPIQVRETPSAFHQNAWLEEEHLRDQIRWGSCSFAAVNDGKNSGQPYGVLVGVARDHAAHDRQVANDVEAVDIEIEHLADQSIVDLRHADRVAALVLLGDEAERPQFTLHRRMAGTAHHGNEVASRMDRGAETGEAERERRRDHLTKVTSKELVDHAALPCDVRALAACPLIPPTGARRIHGSSFLFPAPILILQSRVRKRRRTSGKMSSA